MARKGETHFGNTKGTNVGDLKNSLAPKYLIPHLPPPFSAGTQGSASQFWRRGEVKKKKEKEKTSLRYYSGVWPSKTQPYPMKSYFLVFHFLLLGRN